MPKKPRSAKTNNAYKEELLVAMRLSPQTCWTVDKIKEELSPIHDTTLSFILKKLEEDQLIKNPGYQLAREKLNDETCQRVVVAYMKKHWETKRTWTVDQLRPALKMKKPKIERLLFQLISKGVVERKEKGFRLC